MRAEAPSSPRTPRTQRGENILPGLGWPRRLGVELLGYARIRRALLRDSSEPLVCADRRILKFPRLLSGWWRSVPLELPGESFEKRSCQNTQGLPGELGILLCGFGESQTVQLGIDLNRRHTDIILRHRGSVFAKYSTITLTSSSDAGAPRATMLCTTAFHSAAFIRWLVTTSSE